MSNSKNCTITTAEKNEGRGIFEVKKRYNETDKEAAERKLKIIRNHLRRELKDLLTQEIVNKIQWEVTNRKVVEKKEVTTVRWWITKIC